MLQLAYIEQYIITTFPHGVGGTLNLLTTLVNNKQRKLGCPKLVFEIKII